MSQPTASPDERSKELRLRILVVLGIGFFLVSLSAALVSGFFLMRGDRGTTLDRALPSSCAWVIASRDPAMLRDVLRTLEEDPPRLPAAASPVAAWLPPLAEALARGSRGLDLDEPWAACAVEEGWLLTLALPADERARPTLERTDGVRAFVDALAPRLVGATPGDTGRWQSGAPWGMDLAQARRVGPDHALAVLVTGDRAFVRLQAGDEKAALLGLSELTTPLTRADLGDARVADGTMRDRPAFREAIERVGGGALQVWAPGAVIGPWSRSWGLPEVLAEVAGREGSWWASSVRLDGDAVVFHQHLAGGQRVVVFAKQHLDPRVPLEADAHLPAEPDVTASLVVRYGAETWVRHWNRLAASGAPAQLVEADAFLQRATGAGLRELIGGGNGQLLLTTRGRGEQGRWATIWPRHAGAARSAEAWPAAAREDGWVFVRRGAALALGNDPALVDRALDAFEGAGPTWRDAFEAGALTQTDVDLYRQHGGGLVREANALAGLVGPHPPLRLEWLWLDTGLIVETRLLPGTKRATLPTR